MAKTKAPKPDPSKPLKSAAQDQFCINISKGMQQGPAYSSVPSYRSKTPDVAASKLIRNEKVAARIAYLRGKICTEAEIDVVRVVKEIARIGLFDPAEMFEPDGTLKPIHGMSQDARRAIAGIEITTIKGKETLTKIKFASKSPSHDQLMKHLGAYEKDNGQKAKFLPDLAEIARIRESITGKW